MLGRWAASHFITFLVQAAIGAASGNHASKGWARAVPYFELSLSGVRKYYQQYCGYLGSTLGGVAASAWGFSAATTCVFFLQSAVLVIVISMAVYQCRKDMNT